VTPSEIHDKTEAAYCILDAYERMRHDKALAILQEIMEATS
jgi:hypothetical protein